MARTDTLGHFLTDVANAIRSKTGSSDIIVASDFDTEIENIPSGGVEVEEKDVTFFDYKGNIIYSYSKSEFLELNSLPEDPVFDGFISEGWNWTLSDAKTYLATNNKLDIGQHCITTDGATRIYVNLNNENFLTPYMQFGIGDNGGTATVNWGDDTEPDTVIISGGSTITLHHEYSSVGKYVISINTDSYLRITSYSGGAPTCSLFYGGYNSPELNKMYVSRIGKIELGNVKLDECSFKDVDKISLLNIPKNIIIVDNKNTNYGLFQNCVSLNYITLPSSLRYITPQMFVYCTSLKHVSLPNNMLGIKTGGFKYCYSLKHINIQNTIALVGSYAFQSCWSLCLDNITFSDTITSFGEYAFEDSGILGINLPASLKSLSRYCFSKSKLLTKIKIPSSVTILNYAFNACSNIQYLDFSECNSIPTAYGGDFTGLSSLRKIIVPDDLYEDWIVANNWSSYASYIIKKSDYDNL